MINSYTQAEILIQKTMSGEKKTVVSYTFQELYMYYQTSLHVSEMKCIYLYESLLTYLEGTQHGVLLNLP